MMNCPGYDPFNNGVCTLRDDCPHYVCNKITLEFSESDLVFSPHTFDEDGNCMCDYFREVE
jgi:hypothetical protein